MTVVTTTTKKTKKSANLPTLSQLLGQQQAPVEATRPKIEEVEQIVKVPRTLEELAEFIEQTRGLRKEEVRRFALTPVETLKLRITELPKLLEILPRNWPVLLIGPPGVGKTKGVEMYVKKEAEKLGRKFVPIHLLSEEAIAKLVEKVRQKPSEWYLMLYLHGGRLTEEYQGIPRIGFEVESIARPLAAFLSALASSITGKKVEIKPEEVIERFGEYISKVGVSWKVPLRIAPFVVQLGEEVLEQPELMHKIYEYYTYEVPPKELEEELMKYLPVGTIVIDEATQAPPFFVETMVQGLTGEYVWGEHFISPLTRLILAANPPEYNIEAKYFPEPVMRRVLPVEVEVPTYSEFWYYVREKYPEAPGEILAFLGARPTMLLASSEEIKERAKKYKGYPTPAGWAKIVGLAASMMRGERVIPPDWMYRIVAWTLGEDVAQALYGFLQIETPPPEQILENPQLFIERLKKETDVGKKEMVRMKMMLELIDYLRANKHKANLLIDRLAELFKTLLAAGLGNTLMDMILFATSLRDQELTNMLTQAFMRAVVGTGNVAEIVKNKELLSRITQVWKELMAAYTGTLGK